MTVNHGLAHLSDHFLLATILLYSLAVLAYAGDFAYGRRGGEVGRSAPEPEPELVAVGAADAAAGTPSQAPEAPETPAAATPGGPAGPRGTPAGGAGNWVRAALALTALGLAAHIAGVVTRGFAVHRVPWGDMYEFVTAVTCVAVLFFFGLMLRHRSYRLGLFVIGPVVIILGLAETIIFTPAGPIVPALHSYWLAIHVTAMTLATGTFVVAAVFAMLYLVAERHERRAAAGLPTRGDGIFQALPSPKVIDQFAYRTVIFGFPIWTFGVMAGAIWANEAWGRYWGWDPTETWAFITWVVYAGYLHARATAGWRGRKAAYIQLIAFGCLLFNVLVISLFVTGLHSYAGLS